MNWLDELSKSIGEEPDKIPKDFMTAAQAAKSCGKNAETMRRLFKAGIKKGIVERRMFRVRIATGKVHRLPHYGPKK